MARWRLTEPHYLLTRDPTKWEYQEVDRITGRPKRSQFVVPLYLNPLYEDDTKSFGQPDPDGAIDPVIIVSNGNGAMGKDVIFIGEPTPGMLPLDDEAKEISAKFKAQWDTPALDRPSLSQLMEEKFLSQMSVMQTAAQAVPQAEGVSELMKSMAGMMAQQTEILARLAERPTAGPRRL